MGDAFRWAGHAWVSWFSQVVSGDPAWTGAGGEVLVSSLEPASGHPRQSLGPLFQSGCRTKQRQQGKLQGSSGKQEGGVTREEEAWP